MLINHSIIVFALYSSSFMLNAIMCFCKYFFYTVLRYIGVAIQIANCIHIISALMKNHDGWLLITGIVQITNLVSRLKHLQALTIPHGFEIAPIWMYENNTNSEVEKSFPLIEVLSAYKRGKDGVTVFLVTFSFTHALLLLPPKLMFSGNVFGANTSE